jgi:ankyrin repeat protein
MYNDEAKKAHKWAREGNASELKGCTRAAISTQDGNGETALYKAVDKTKPDAVKAICAVFMPEKPDRLSALINLPNRHGRTPWMRAFSRRDWSTNGPEAVKILHVLLDNGANIKASFQGDTPLHTVCDVAVLKRLIDQGLSIEIRGAEGNTPLEAHVAANNVDAAEFLLAKGARKAPRCNPTGEFGGLSGNSHLVGSAQSLRMVKLLKKHKVPLDEPIRGGGLTPLLYHCKQGQQSSLLIAMFLLENGANAKARTGGGNALHILGMDLKMTSGQDAALGDVATLLISKGAEINENIPGMGSPLIVQCQASVAVSKVLLKQPKINIKAADEDGCQALHLTHFSEIVGLLLGFKGVDKEAKNRRGYTPLLQQLLWDLEGEVDTYADEVSKIALRFIEAGCDVRVKSINGWTLLHLAPTLEVATKLVKMGAEIDGKRVQEGTPLLYHCKRGLLASLGETGGGEADKISQLLIEEGANIENVDTDGNSPLHLTISPEVVTLLLRKNPKLASKRNEEGILPIVFHFHNASAENLSRLLDAAIDAGGEEVKSVIKESSAELLSEAPTANCVVELLKNGAEVDAKMKDSGLPTLMVRFLRRGAADHEILKVLIKGGADVTFVDPQTGNTLLHLVSDAKTVKLLLSSPNKPDIEAKDKEGRTPLLVAAGHRAGVVKELIKQGAKTDEFDNAGNTFMHHCKFISILTDLIVKKKTLPEASLKATNKKGQTVLHTAVQSRDATATKKVVDFFMEHGVDVNQADDDGDTPLHLVERDSVAQELIKKRALPTAKNKKGEYPLHRAASNGYSTAEVALFLLDRGDTDVNAQDNAGNTALLSATDEVAEQLLGMGADCKLKNKNGKTCLHNSNLMKLSTLQKIWDKGANLLMDATTTREGSTPLHTAVYDPVVQFLLMAGANHMKKDKKGRTPLHTAASMGIANELIEHCGDDLQKFIDMKDNSGQTALQSANDASIANFLLECGAAADAKTLEKAVVAQEKLLEIAQEQAKEETVKAADIHAAAKADPETKNAKKAVEATRDLTGAGATGLLSPRVALIIGIGKYEHYVDLGLNPVNDANAIEKELLNLGWRSEDIFKVTDATLEQVKRAQKKFQDHIEEAVKQTAEGGGGSVTALSFFAGHGIQITPPGQAAEAENYLLASDSKLDKESDARFACLKFKDLAEGVEDAGADFRIFILDCCRNNPELSRSLYGATRGGDSQLNVKFGSSGAAGTITAYSCAPGKNALNGGKGEGAHGIFTEHLLRQMRKPGVNIQDSIQCTQHGVAQACGQEPRMALGYLTPEARKMLWGRTLGGGSGGSTGANDKVTVQEEQLRKLKELYAAEKRKVQQLEEGKGKKRPVESPNGGSSKKPRPASSSTGAKRPASSEHGSPTKRGRLSGSKDDDLQTLLKGDGKGTAVAITLLVKHKIQIEGKKLRADEVNELRRQMKELEALAV